MSYLFFCSDGTQFAPRLTGDETLYTFSPEICRYAYAGRLMCDRIRQSYVSSEQGVLGLFHVDHVVQNRRSVRSLAGHE